MERVAGLRYDRLLWLASKPPPTPGPPATPMDGQVIDGKYQVVRLLGQGGMGRVYEARHLGTGRRVAVKLIVAEALLRGGDIIARFQREARASGAIDSQHVVQVLDTGVDAQSTSPYMVMEYLTGEDLQQSITRLGPLPPDVALRVMAQACVGLQRAHEAGIIHRDIKSANMFLSRREGGETVVKILDFGIAKVRADQFAAGENHGLTKTGSMLGSPLYMSPEQAKGLKDLDARADIWSLGVAFYEALTGLTPHAHCDTIGQLIIAICSEKPRPVQQKAPWISANVAAIVHRALMTDATERFQSASEMNAAIEALLPQGCSIQSSMLQPLSPQERACVAPRFAETPWPVSEPKLGQSPFASTTANTTAGVGSSTQTTAAGLPKRTPAALWLSPLALLTLSGIGVGAWKIHASKSDSVNGTPSSASSSTQAITGASQDFSGQAIATAPFASASAIPSSSASSASSASVPTSHSVAIPPAVHHGSSAHGGAAIPPTEATTAKPAPSAKVNCDPPFSIDTQGRKVFKPECT